jgi:hypothetical protein
MMKPTLILACTLLAATTAMTALAAHKANRISFEYEVPKNPVHVKIYDEMKERRVLERLQEFLSPYKLPRTLEIRVAECDGEADAFYGDDEITICYEYVEELWNNMPEQTTPSGVAPFDALAGPFFDTCLHEFAHALFDIFDIPVLGRIEDAADQVAAYIYLQLGPKESRRLIGGTAYAFLHEAQNKPVPSLTAYADEHGTPAQRAYNVLCIAYGADTKVFGNIARGGYLPPERAEFCEEEYEQVQDAYEELIGPHVDQDLADEIFERSWIVHDHPYGAIRGSP